MAQVDVQWPSEDEDFDAVTDKPKKTSGKLKSNPVEVRDDDSTQEINIPELAAEPEIEPEEAPGTEESADNENAEPSEADEPANEPESEADDQPVVISSEPAVDSQEEAAPEEAAPEETSAEEEPAPEVSAAAVTPVSSIESAKTGRNGSSLLRAVLEVILFVALVGVGLWAWTLHSDNTNLKKQVTLLNNNPQIAVQKQTDNIISHVGALTQLPTGESPTIANVTDAAQAKQQSAFFNTAENGDKVLMYVKAGEAILYRPSTNKIILIAPLTFNNAAAASSTKATTTPAKTTTKTTQ